VKRSLNDEYVKKPSAHGMSTFNRNSVESNSSSLILLNLTLKVPCVFLPNFAIFDIVGKINFSKNKNMGI
jgi:hypothetical protein